MLVSEDNADLIVRMFRLRPASNAAIIVLVSILALLAGGVALLVVRERRREARRRIVDGEAELQRILGLADLAPSEKALFDRLVQAAGGAAPPCATSAKAFDRGAEALLERAAGEDERRELSRGLLALRRKLGLATFRSGVPVGSTRSIPADLPVVVTLPQRDGEVRPVTGRLVATNEEEMTIRLAGPAVDAGAIGSGREVEVAFSNPGDASYAFRSKASRVRERGPAFLVVPHSASLTRVQDRGFARVDMTAVVRFRWLPQGRVRHSPRPGGRLEEPARDLSGVLTSISGGGIRLRTDARLAVGDYIRLTLPFLPEPFAGEPCFAEVVRSRGSGTFGLRFEGIDSRFQEAIIQHVRQEELRRIKEERKP